MRTPQAYANPYLAGVGLGLVLLTAFVLTGQGLGASGAFASAAAGAVKTAAPGQVAAHPWFQRYLSNDPWADWLVFEIAGVFVGAFVSALLAGRLRGEVERGPSLAPGPRLAFAVAGGLALGVGAVLARGCTSGQALTGGAVLSVGSWLFMIGAFAAAYAVAPLARRLWR